MLRIDMPCPDPAAGRPTLELIGRDSLASAQDDESNVCARPALLSASVDGRSIVRRLVGRPAVVVRQ